MTGSPESAVIFCAGEGTRLRPLTEELPKCLVEIGGEPLLFRSLEALSRAGVRRFCVNTHHLAGELRQAVEGSEWADAVTLSHEPTLLGSAGALRTFSDELSRPFYAMYGDVFTDTDVTRLWELHQAGSASVTMLVHDRVDPTTGGMVVFDATTGRVASFTEKPRAAAVVSPWVSAGVFVMDPSTIAYVPEGAPSDIGHDLIPSLLSAGEPVYALPIESSAFLVDIGTHEALALARSIAEARA